MDEAVAGLQQSLMSMPQNFEQPTATELAAGILTPGFQSSNLVLSSLMGR